MTYEMLTAQLPGRVYVLACARNLALPAAVDDVLRRGLARDRAERHAGVAEFDQDLEKALQISLEECSPREGKVRGRRRSRGG